MALKEANLSYFFKHFAVLKKKKKKVKTNKPESDFHKGGISQDHVPPKWNVFILGRILHVMSKEKPERGRCCDILPSSIWRGEDHG